ncbi:MAG: adenylyl-sulfate kinase [Nitrospirae bacterium]|nr:adenylyl-sulfate kinase [Nitrospirota bacterium]
MKNNVTWHRAAVTREMREKQNGHKSVVVWFTGLSSSGKSTIAHAVEEQMHQIGCKTFVFDGDNVRHGLNKNLGFSRDDRKENIRRIGEMCKLFIEAGVIALTAFISPYREDRNMIRQMVKENDFIEIYCKCSIDVCESRDKKGIYLKARKGEIPEFTGISAPYEIPENPEMVIDTKNMSIEECVNKVMNYLSNKGIIHNSHKMSIEIPS